MKYAAMLFAATLAHTAPAVAKPHSKVEAKAEATSDVIKFDFKVSFDDGLHLNKDAPWSLELKPAAGLEFKQTKLGKGDLDASLPGFRAQTAVKPTAAKGTLPYTLTAFVCTDDKKMCYRDVLKGEVEWKKD